MDLYKLIKQRKLRFVDNGSEVNNDGWIIKNENDNTTFHLLIDGKWRELYSKDHNDEIQVLIQ
jgi:hypothetical protein